jgi:hypothetical protein
MEVDRELKSLMQDADVFTEVDRSLWHDLIEELRERYAAARLRLRENRREFPTPKANVLFRGRTR